MDVEVAVRTLTRIHNDYASVQFINLVNYIKYPDKVEINSVVNSLVYLIYARTAEHYADSKYDIEELLKFFYSYYIAEKLTGRLSKCRLISTLKHLDYKYTKFMEMVEVGTDH